MIGHVKINYRPENQGCTPFTGLVLLTIIQVNEIYALAAVWISCEDSA